MLIPPALSMSQVACPTNVRRTSAASSAARRTAAGRTRLGASDTARHRSATCASAGAVEANARTAASTQSRGRAGICHLEDVVASVRSAVEVPAPLPLPDHAIVTLAGSRLRGDDARRRSPTGNLQQELAADGGLELVDLLDRHHEGAGAADNAGRIVAVEVRKIEEAGRADLEHDGQAVDDDAVG